MMVLDKDVIDGTAARQFFIRKVFASSTRPRKFLIHWASKTHGNMNATVVFSQITPSTLSPSIKVRPPSLRMKVLDGAKAVFERRCLDFIRQSRIMEED